MKPPTKPTGPSNLQLKSTNRFAVLGLPDESEYRTTATTATPAATAVDPGTRSIKPRDEKMTTQKVAAPSSSKQGKVTESEQQEWTEDLMNDYQRILSVGEECISPVELKALLLRKGRGTDPLQKFVLYDGFEPSGRMHIAQGVFKAMNVNKCTAVEGTNATFVFWVADWFALMNDKMGGDLEKIKTVGHYLIEVWKAAGMELGNVVFKWASDEITQQAHIYWPIMLDVARRFTITRIKKCCQIMGRLEGSLTAAQILYPLMQCTDIFFLKADICQLGVDQRKVNMLAREYCDSAKRKIKPIILSHHMLYGLKAGQEKMSKSDPDSAIFMEDTTADVERKIQNAYCPNREISTTTTTDTTTSSTTTTIDAGKESMQLVEDNLKNPCLDYIKNIIFSPPNATFTAGDNVTYTDFETVKDAFLKDTLSEEQLKSGLIQSLNLLLEPVRQHFTNNDTAKNLLRLVQQYKKETLTTTTTEQVIRRLDLVQLQKVAPNTHVVFAPLPTATPSLQMAIDILEQIKAGVVSNQCVVLYLQDWSAIVSNACNADTKVIAAFYTVLITSLKALDPTAMKDHVQIVYQSESILLDPSNYWINVINIGRFFMLNQIMGTTMTDEDNAGLIIARLMHIADIAAIDPKSIALSSSSADDQTSSQQQQQELWKDQSTLIAQYYEGKLPGLTAPEYVLVATPTIRLQLPKESDALKTENDEYFILDDPKIHGKSKMKKAFCEPGNISFCPPISIASTFVLNKGESFEIKRTNENGGNKLYTTKQLLEDDFVQGELVLHPGDLKASATSVAITVLEGITKCIQSDKASVAASKTLKAFSKKKK